MKLDNRGLEPPNPMMRTLEALESIGVGEVLTIINDRRPMFLFEQLDEKGYKYTVDPLPDGSYQITITKTN